jgi:ElaB/YqjD/DUF883 family membrane-anchored ribosome-binding protein
VAAFLAVAAHAQTAKAFIREWDLPKANTFPHDPLATPDGSLWYTGFSANVLGRLRRQGEDVADYLIDAGKELVDKCEDLYERSGEVVEDVAHDLSAKYRALHEYSRQLLDDAETILRRAKSAASGRQ